MAAQVQPAGVCEKCGNAEVNCKYNHFSSDELEIHAWEHKCGNCGARDTTAYRSDEDEEDDAPADPRVCPYCQRRGGEA